MVTFEVISFQKQRRTFVTDCGGCIDFARFAAVLLVTFHRPCHGYPGPLSCRMTASKCSGDVTWGLQELKVSVKTFKGAFPNV